VSYGILAGSVIVILIPSKLVFFNGVSKPKVDPRIFKNKEYKMVRHRFLSEYDRENPITQREAMTEYLDWIKSRSLLT
jgi:hypothetical protein